MIAPFCSESLSARNSEELLTLREAVALAKAHPNSLRKWSDSGKVKTLRTPGGKRRWLRSSLLAMLGDRETVIEDGNEQDKVIRVLIYARVSSRGQSVPSSLTVEKSSLDHQLDRLKQFVGEHFRGKHIETTYVKNVKSGLDFENESFLNNVIKPILEGKYDYLVIQDKTRLARFAYSLISYLCKLGGCEILHALDDKQAEKTENEVLMDDLLSVLTCFTASSNAKKAKWILQVNVTPEILNDILLLHSQCHSHREIAKRMEKENKTGIDGRPITRTVVDRLVKENKSLIPQLINTSSAQYVRQGCTFLQFAQERLRVAEGSIVSFKAVREAYRKWAFGNGESPVDTADRVLHQRLVKQFPSVSLDYTASKTRLYRGLAILSND